MILPSLLVSHSRNGTRFGPTAAVERAHSDRARSGSKGSTRVSFRSLYRARSASKKGTWPLPSISLLLDVIPFRRGPPPHLSPLLSPFPVGDLRHILAI